MDHQNLLKKYIAHVTACQGVDFITMGRTQSSVSFTSDERQELDQLSEAVELDFVLGERATPEELPTLATQATPNLTALFNLIGNYIRTVGPVSLEFRDGDRVISDAQDAFLRHLSERVQVISND